MLGDSNRDDPILRELNGEYRKLRRALRQPLVFTSLRTSFLANRILHDDPFHGFNKPRKLPRTSISTTTRRIRASSKA